MSVQHIPGTKTAQPTVGKLSKAANRFGDLLLAYWANFLMVLLGVLVLCAISVPFLSYFGFDSVSKSIFFSLHYVCAQVPSHSFYILGHQLGLCARNFSIYTSMFLTSVLFVLSKKRLVAMPWWVWILMIIPMGIDGTTQMFGLRESTWELRLITGTLFGVGSAWFVLTFMQRTIEETTPPSQQGSTQYSLPRSTK